MSDLTEFFGPSISSYSRAQALDDGTLIDVSELAREAGFKYPVALTAAAWGAAVAVPKSNRIQSEKGRLWDVLNVLMFHIRLGAGGETVHFKLRVGKRNVVLKSLCGPGDDAEPVITIMLPDED